MGKSRTQKRREKRKAKKEAEAAVVEERGNGAPDQPAVGSAAQAEALGVEVEYVSESAVDSVQGTEFADLADVFSKFASVETLMGTGEKPEEEGPAADGGEGALDAQTPAAHGEEDGGPVGEGEVDLAAMSNRKRKALLRLSVAELKQLVDCPEVVEAHDVTSHEPKLLVALKAARNAVPVPRHWSQKRKYLQGKRGFDKVPYELPAHIAATGIGIIRDASLEKDNAKSLKQRMRERVRPKRGQMEIEYEKLYDAFFQHAKAPRTAGFGELYYENKEIEHRYGDKRPGKVSDRLREALGMAQGDVPAPWLINMQRFGPPPSYPNLDIPGLNATLPPGASYGFQPGGWGKPPVDAAGKALYGDPFGLEAAVEAEEGGAGPGVTGSGAFPTGLPKWGELQDVDSEDEEEEEEEEAAVEAPAAAPVPEPDHPPPPSTVGGADTPSTVQLRKGAAAGDETPLVPPPAHAHTVLHSRAAEMGEGIVGTGHVYDIPPEGSIALSKGGGTASVASGIPGGAASVSGVASVAGSVGGVKRGREAVDVEEAAAKRYKDFKF